MRAKELERIIETAVDRAIEKLQAEKLLKEVTAAGEGAKIVEKAYSQWDMDALGPAMDDRYFVILPMYYNNGMTLEQIAGELGCDVSTVSRHKKRLCEMVYHMQKSANLHNGQKTE